ncbi:MAG TPA: hypothetical protein DEG17_08440 [Cyanobacteria bacterium UBA11149]|nr:hypothetical protein [Cyanobacteria bacterium UBA11367]HBE59739.1 hypothetical protein [Cyanobacteria bacterium UBA11366]HBK65352.1 hypothetical protein [Cyanobacteria bacterium UBA11166]HBR76569.1 hypothetical protein [Cyanobacteria bacterium UBA11159]HBS68178.1 hypothetical protein [Cyanobacteria bacterium UBA11153]HBW88887.1 hypothetical protein [Cyanobacteria bacterium UBA11149]HCA94580.1 hypothetical protein [Cyanobacteria bacterium UBA9226]
MIKSKLQDILLQSLRIPTGWTVDWNQFYDVEPDADFLIEGLPNGDVWELFLQDLLQLKYSSSNLILDLSWIPEADPNGTYQLELILNEDWVNPLITFQSRNKNEIVNKINRLLLEVVSGKISI